MPLTEYLPDRPIYDRQKGEGRLAWAAFRTYRDNGQGRTIWQVFDPLREILNGCKTKSGKPITPRILATMIEKWFDDWCWQERIQVYDADKAIKEHYTAIREVNDMDRRHITEAKMMQTVAIQSLQSLQNPNSGQTTLLDPAEIRRWIEAAAKLERVSRGKPTKIEEQLVSKSSSRQIHVIETIVHTREEVDMIRIQARIKGEKILGDDTE